MASSCFIPVVAVVKHVSVQAVDIVRQVRGAGSERDRGTQLNERHTGLQVLEARVARHGDVCAGGAVNSESVALIQRLLRRRGEVHC